MAIHTYRYGDDAHQLGHDLGELTDWDPNQVHGDAYDSDRAGALYDALDVDRDDTEYTLAAHADGRLGLFGLSVRGHRFAIEKE